MKKTIYIFLAFVFAVTSCTMTEMDPIVAGRDGYVELIARPMSFTGYNVGGVSTKAYSEEELTSLERAIYSAYLLIYKPNGELMGNVVNIDIDPATGVIPAQKIKNDPSYNDVTVCLLANVPYDYAHSLDTYEKFQTTPLPIEYADYAETGYIGVPKMTLTLKSNRPNETTVKECFPMCGVHQGLFGESAQVVIPLKRLFAKVQVNLSMDMGYNLLENILGGTLSDLFGDLLGGITPGNTAENARFELNGCTLSDLPTQVLMVEPTKTDDGSQPTAESAWVRDASKFVIAPDIPIDDEEKTIYDKTNPRADQPGFPTSFSRTFYTPEYLLLPEASQVSSYQNQTNPERYKPLLYDTSKKALHITFEGRLHDHGGSYANVKYRVFFGEDNFDSFSLFRNNLYSNNLVIKGVGHLTTGDNIDNRVEVLPLDLVDAYKQAANCYIISIPGTYELEAYKGVVKESDLATASKFTGKPYTVWNTTSSTNVISYIDADTAQDKIVFSVSNESGSITPGNAVIAIRDASNNILWSWHLWFCEPDSRPDNTDFQHNYPTSGALVMNRALGATTAIADGILSPLKSLGYDLAIWNDGLYYQWGRKDPMVLGSGNKMAKTASSATYANSIINPDTFYTDWKGEYTNETVGWTDTKSTNDPCPPGYKVPNNTIWRTANNSTGMEDLFSLLPDLGYPYNLNASVDVSHNVVYPYSGQVGTNGTLIEEVEVMSRFNDPNFSFESIAAFQKEQRRYTNIILDVELSVTHGSIWTADKKIFKYGYGSASLTELVDRITLTEAYMSKRTRSSIISSWGSWGTPVRVTGSTVNTTDKATLMAQLVLTGHTLNERLCEISTASSSDIASGSMVRCVME